MAGRNAVIGENWGKTIGEKADEICKTLDDVNTLIVQIGGQRDALADRLKRIDILVAQALNAKPEDLKGLWLRVGQIAGGKSDG